MRLAAPGAWERRCSRARRGGPLPRPSPERGGELRYRAVTYDARATAGYCPLYEERGLDAVLELYSFNVNS